MYKKAYGIVPQLNKVLKYLFMNKLVIVCPVKCVDNIKISPGVHELCDDLGQT